MQYSTVRYCCTAAGGQYCSWHPDSSLVALTSDGLHAAFVFNVLTEQRVGNCVATMHNLGVLGSLDCRPFISASLALGMCGC